MDQALKSAFVPALRESGFRGTYPHFRREGPTHVEVVGVQFSQWGGQFYIEVGLGDKAGESLPDGSLVPGAKLKHYHVWPRERIGAIPFDYEATPVPEVAQQAAATIAKIDAWFLNRRT
jgi:hypothetical protein